MIINIYIFNENIIIVDNANQLSKTLIENRTVLMKKIEKILHDVNICAENGDSPKLIIRNQRLWTNCIFDHNRLGGRNHNFFSALDCIPHSRLGIGNQVLRHYFPFYAKFSSNCVLSGGPALYFTRVKKWKSFFKSREWKSNPCLLHAFVPLRHDGVHNFKYEFFYKINY